MARGLLRFLRGNTIALLALFVALGGTTYAATALPKNSVGAKQLKKNAVTNPKIRKGAVTGAKVANNSIKGADVLESSLAKVPSATRADNATHATSADAAPYIDSLPAGKTLRGAWAVRGADLHQYAWILFPHRTAVPTTFHFIAPGAAPPAQCPGTVADPQAQSGHLCVYANNVFTIGGGTMAFTSEFDPETATNNVAGRDGAVLFFTATGATDAAAYGTWAVTGN
jgi:hypothetical protein